MTIDEMLQFLELCWRSLRPKGVIVVYGLNGANRSSVRKNLAHNIDHFNMFTEYSLNQVLELARFRDIKILPLKLYVFWHNPLNYVGLIATGILSGFFRACFILYGKDVKIDQEDCRDRLQARLRMGAAAIAPLSRSRAGLRGVFRRYGMVSPALVAADAASRPGGTKGTACRALSS